MAIFKREDSGNLSFSGSLGFKLQNICIYLEWRLWAIIFLALLIMGSSCVSFFLNPWLSCLANFAAGLFSLWLGYTALTKVKEIKILEREEVG